MGDWNLPNVKKERLYCMKSFVTLSVNIEGGYILQGFANIYNTHTMYVN